MATQFASVTSQEEIIKINFLWCIALDIYLAASRLGKYPPLATSTSVNSC